MKKRRIIKRRRGGIVNTEAPYWKGERAEDIVRQRVAGYKKPKRQPSARRRP